MDCHAQGIPKYRIQHKPEDYDAIHEKAEGNTGYEIKFKPGYANSNTNNQVVNNPDFPGTVKLDYQIQKFDPIQDKPDYQVQCKPDHTISANPYYPNKEKLDLPISAKQVKKVNFLQENVLLGNDATGVSKAAI